jgi:hypothetical protein
VTAADGACVPCAVGSYCADGFQATPCGAHSTSLAGSSSQAQCECVSGYTSLGDVCVTKCYSTGGAFCALLPPSTAADENPVYVADDCPAGFYCLGGIGGEKSPCTVAAGNYCPVRTASSAGVPCPSGSYCPGGTGDAVARAHACPSNADTLGLTGQSSCTCAVGFSGGRVTAADGACVPCAVGSYCADGFQATPCGAHSTSPAGSSSQAQCECVSGYTSVDGVCVIACFAAPGSFCQATGGSTTDPILTLAACPPGFFCVGGRGAALAPCTAAPGSYCPAGSVGSAGILCPLGFYCSGGVADRVLCTVPSGVFCPLGSSLPSGIQCPLGFYCTGGGTGMKPCTAAPGSYCSAGSSSQDGVQCPQGSFCTGGVAGPIPCSARAGYYCPAGTSDPFGELCPQGSYCSSQAAAPAPCAAAAGAYCPAGTLLADGLTCPTGYFCVGRNADKAQCTAIPGYYCATGSAAPGGVECPAGFACAGA